MIEALVLVGMICGAIGMGIGWHAHDLAEEGKRERLSEPPDLPTTKWESGMAP